MWGAHRWAATLGTACLVSAAIVTAGPAQAATGPVFTVAGATWGQQMVLHGNVGSPAGGVAVQAWSGGACTGGAWTYLSEHATSASDGSFTLHLYPACPGSADVLVAAGEAPDQASVAQTVSVQRAADQLVLSGPVATDVHSGERVSFFPQLALGSGAGTLTVTRKEAGRGTSVVWRGPMVDGLAGGFSNHVRVVRNATLTATFTGDDGNLPATISRRFAVHPVLAPWVQAQHSQRCGPDCSKVHQADDPFIAVSAEKYGPKRILLVLQKRSSQGWVTVQRRHASTRSDTGVRLTKHALGDSFRFRGIVPNSARWARSFSAWHTVRFR